MITMGDLVQYHCFLIHSQVLYSVPSLEGITYTSHVNIQYYISQGISLIDYHYHHVWSCSKT